MALSGFPRIRTTETEAQMRAREDAVRAAKARRDFERLAVQIATAHPLAPGTEDLSDLDLSETATALGNRTR